MPEQNWKQFAALPSENAASDMKRKSDHFHGNGSVPNRIGGIGLGTDYGNRLNFGISTLNGVGMPVGLSAIYGFIVTAWAKALGCFG